ncbi:hypothetical protein FQN54_007503 [Arachnomyces sp. PD_36]|nr:hypothetical protein FQN54_007503 [Arachnomyces sp. PD_36]
MGKTTLPIRAKKQKPSKARRGTETPADPCPHETPPDGNHTCTHPYHAEYSADNLPPLLFQLEPTPFGSRDLSEVPQLTQNGNIVKDYRGEPIRDFPFLPRYIARKPAAWLLEFWMRTDHRVNNHDIKARMTVPENQLPSGAFLTNLRETGARRPLGLSCWSERSPISKAELERNMRLTHDQITLNTTMRVEYARSTRAHPIHLVDRSYNLSTGKQYDINTFLSAKQLQIPKDRTKRCMKLLYSDKMDEYVGEPMESVVVGALEAQTFEENEVTISDLPDLPVHHDDEEFVPSGDNTLVNDEPGSELIKSGTSEHQPESYRRKQRESSALSFPGLGQWKTSSTRGATFRSMSDAKLGNEMNATPEYRRNQGQRRSLPNPFIAPRYDGILSAQDAIPKYHYSTGETGNNRLGYKTLPIGPSGDNWTDTGNKRKRSSEGTFTRGIQEKVVLPPLRGANGENPCEPLKSVEQLGLAHTLPSKYPDLAFMLPPRDTYVSPYPPMDK